jgi:hypothetical protein
VDTLARVSSASLGELGELEKLISRLSHADREFLRSIKLTLRAGVQVFEKYERHVISRGASELLEVLRSMPEVFRKYYSEF